MGRRAGSLGFSLIEVVIGLGLVTVIMASLVSVLNVMSKKSGEIENSSWAYDLRFEVTNAVNNRKAFETYTMAANPSFACVTNKTDCAGQGGAILLMDAGGKIIPQVAVPGNSMQGLTGKGKVCNTYGATPECVYRYEASWTPICGTGDCKGPQVQINTRMLVSPLAKANAIKVDNFSLRVNLIEKGVMDLAKICITLGGTVIGTKCVLKVANPCADATHPFLLGYTSDGTPRCGYESGNTRCPAGGVLTSLNADGTYTCAAGCALTGAGGGTFGFTD